MPNDSDDIPDSNHAKPANDSPKRSASDTDDVKILPEHDTEPGGLIGWVKGIFGKKPVEAETDAIRKTIEDYIDDSQDDDQDPITCEEKALLGNILKLRDLSVFSVMVPRANIFAVDVNTAHDDLLAILAEKQFSRIPVYQDTLDEVLGTVHVKDIIATIASGSKVKLQELIIDLPIVSPTLPLLDLLLKMRQSRRHMALVVDEFGGIDGLVTVGDVLESIVGQIEDEHDIEQQPKIVEKDDGSILADARMDIHEFEEEYGTVFSETERDDSDTLGGLVFALAGRVPARGEILTHNTGMVFEVLDADPRRINRLRIRNIPEADE